MAGLRRVLRPVFKVLRPLTPGGNVEAQAGSAEEREKGTPGKEPGVDEVKSIEVRLGFLSGWPGHRSSCRL